MTTTVTAGQPVSSNFSWVGYKSFTGGFPDGLSNTILWTEKVAVCNNGGVDGGTRWAARGQGSWMPTVGVTESGVSHLASTLKPQVGIGTPAACDWFQPSSSHTGTLQVALADGSVRSVSGQVSQTTFNIALVPDDGLVLGSDW